MKITKIHALNTYTPCFSAKKRVQDDLYAVNRNPVTQETIAALANNWSKQDLIYEGDSLIIIPKSHLYEAAKFDKKIAHTLPKTELSDLGFAVSILDEEGRIDTKALQYFDPKVITILKLVNQIRNNKTYIVPLESYNIED
jgi:hypothetical protein